MKKLKLTKRNKIIIAVIIILAAVGICVWGMIPPEFLTVSEVMDNPNKYKGKEIEVKGTVANLNATGPVKTFDLTDGKSVMHVEYEGALPSEFKEGKDVVVKGKLEARGEEWVFKATEITVGCPSKF
jgi:cytochrome c-type biogenesis protein CcmE